MENATELDVLQHLSEKQRQAIVFHLQGMSDAAVAEKLELQRSTVWRWRQCPHYAVALNTEREELWRDTKERLRFLASAAIDVIEGALADRDVKTAWKILEAVRLDDIPAAVEPVTLDEFLRQQAERDARSEYHQQNGIGDMATMLEDLGIDAIANRRLNELRETYGVD